MPVVSTTAGGVRRNGRLVSDSMARALDVGIEASDATARARATLGLDDEMTELTRRCRSGRRGADPTTPLPRRPNRRRAAPRSRAVRRRARTMPRPRRTHVPRCRSPPGGRRPLRVGPAAGTPSTPGAAPTPSRRRPGRSDRGRRHRNGPVAHPRRGGDHPADESCERRPDVPRRCRDPVAHDQLAGVVDDAGREAGDAEIDRQVGELRSGDDVAVGSAASVTHSQPSGRAPRANGGGASRSHISPLSVYPSRGDGNSGALLSRQPESGVRVRRR